MASNDTLILKLLGAACVVIVLAVFLFVPPFAQWLEYHNFADKRPLAGITNAMDVLSNGAFILAGIAGLAWTRRAVLQSSAERVIWVMLFVGAIATGFGSGFYHLAPDNDRLVWDRLPMTIAFMALLAAVIAETVSVRAGINALLPLLVIGAGSVFYWIWSEHRGAGDLRAYGLVQFLPVPVILTLLWKRPTPYSRKMDYGWVICWYGAAKLLEALDEQVFAIGNVVSGHTLKHLAAAAAILQLGLMLKRRTIRT